MYLDSSGYHYLLRVSFLRTEHRIRKTPHIPFAAKQTAKCLDIRTSDRFLASTWIQWSHLALIGISYDSLEITKYPKDSSSLHILKKSIKKIRNGRKFKKKHWHHHRCFLPLGRYMRWDGKMSGVVSREISVNIPRKKASNAEQIMFWMRCRTCYGVGLWTMVDSVHVLVHAQCPSPSVCYFISAGWRNHGSGNHDLCSVPARLDTDRATNLSPKQRTL